jgi:ATP-dependent Clp protease protease subunit
MLLRRDPKHGRPYHGIQTESGRFAEEGILFLSGAINAESAQDLVESMIGIAMMPEGARPEYSTIYINCPGGCLYSTIKIVDTIHQMPYPVATTVSGYAASGGLFVAMAGQKGMRAATQNSMLMSHQFASGGDGYDKYHELRANFEGHERVNERLEAAYKRYTGKSLSYIRKKLMPAHDVTMTAAEAKEHGLIDHVLEF